MKNKKSYYDEFTDTIFKTTLSKYEISLPFKENHPLLLHNFELSKQRLRKLNDKLKEKPNFCESIMTFFLEQKCLEIIEEDETNGEIRKTHLCGY